MDKENLQKYVEEHIPIVKKMNFKIEKLDKEGISVKALYSEHINHRNSVFGGSISSLMTTSAWGWVKYIMEEIDEKSTIVIQESQVKYLKPVLSDFTASTNLENFNFERNKRMYEKFGKTRINVFVDLKEKGKDEVLASFKGIFVILK